MSSRKPLRSSGSGSKKQSTSQEACEDESREEGRRLQENIVSDAERRRTRVTISTSSPKTFSGLSLRVVRSKPLQTSLPSRTHLASSPISKASKTPQLSFRAKSPDKQSWLAPTLRSPAYHESSLPRRKTMTKIPQDILRAQPRRPSMIRYSVDQLLALRPPANNVPDRLKRAAISSTGGSEQTVIHHDLGSAYLDQIYGSHGQRFSIVPPQKLCTWRSESVPYVPDILLLNHTWMQQHDSAHNSPTPYDTAPVDHIPRQIRSEMVRNSSSQDYSTHDQTASVDDLESRIRSALSSRGRRRTGGISRNIRSVRWDPAVVEAGSNAVGHAAGTEVTEIVDNDTARHAEPQKEGNQSSKQVNHAERKEVRIKQKREFYDYMKRIIDLKKGDRKKLLHLLEALQALDDNYSSSSDSEVEKSAGKPNKAEIPQQGQKLDPTATSFCSTSNVISGDLSSELRGREGTQQENRGGTVHRISQDSSSNEVVWVRTRDFNPSSHSGHEHYAEADLIDTPPDFTQPLGGKNVTENSQSRNNNISARRSMGYSNLYSTGRRPFPSVVGHRSKIPRTHPTTFHEEGSRQVDPNLPIIDLLTGQIPSEHNHGREAYVVPWGTYILERFQEKYPLTGRMRAKPPAQVQSNHAATIQQRLEYLLLEQKERKARGEALTERGINIQSQGVANSVFQREKQVLKRLKSEIRRDELDRKIQEIGQQTMYRKINVHTFGNATTRERSSESSTGVESSTASACFNTEVDEDRTE